MQWLNLTPKLKPKYQGNYNFHVQLNTQVIDSSTTLNITAYTNKQKTAVVPCSYQWFIIKNGVPQEINQFRGSSFICETNHIGYLVQAHITSNDSQFNGKSIVSMGPVELDVTLKTQILGSLSQGYSNLAVYLIGPQQEQRQCTIQVYQDKIRLMHAFSDLHYTFQYSLMEPLFTHNPKDINHITIHFNQKYQQELKRFEKRLFNKDDISFSRSNASIKFNNHNSSSSSQGQQLKVQMRFLTRANRDTFLYTLKAFITKREIKNEAVIRKIEKMTFEQSDEFSAVHLVNEMRRDLVRYDRAYKKLATDRRKSQDKDRNMSSITSFTKPEPQPTQSEPLTNKVHQLQRQNQSLNTRIHSLVYEINNIKTTNSNSNKTPSVQFKKKKNAQDNTIAHLLDDLSRSEHIVHFDAQNQKAIEKLQQQKRTLQVNLDQASQKIIALEKRNCQPQLPPGIITIEKIFVDRVISEKEEIKKTNERLEREVRKAKESSLLAHAETKRKSQVAFSEGVIARETEDLKSKLFISEQQLEEANRARERYEEKCLSSSRKVIELESEIEMFRKNQDVLNRSQSLSYQMDDYNEEQIKMLKEQNGFLIAQNQKLAKSCERYMSEAKEAIKMRKEIMVLRQKINKAYTNPEAQSFTT